MPARHTLPERLREAGLEGSSFKGALDGEEVQSEESLFFELKGVLEEYLEDLPGDFDL